MPACSAISGSSCGASCPRRRLPRPRKACSAQTSCRRICPTAWPTNCPRGPGCTGFLGSMTCFFTSARANRCARAFSAISPPNTPRRRSRSSRDQVRRVDWLETAGELGALLREAEWIRTQQPLYNRRLKPSSRERDDQIRRGGGAPSSSRRSADLEPARARRLLRRVSFAQGCAQGVDGHRPRAAALPEGPGSGAERRLVLRLPARQVQGRVRRQGSRSSCTVCGCRRPCRR